MHTQDFNLTHYAAANSSMDWFAEECRKKGDLNVISTQWGALATEGGMALESTRKLMDQRGHGDSDWSPDENYSTSFRFASRGLVFSAQPRQVHFRKARAC